MPGLFSTRRGETNRGSRVLGTGNFYPPPRRLPIIYNRRSAPTDRRTILSQWRNLQGLKYIDHQKLAPLIDVEENRNIALELKGKDAAVVINTIDKVSPTSRTHESRYRRLHAARIFPSA